jgi:hypothetical protein
MTTLTVGTCNISATQASDGQGGAGGTGTTSVTIAKGNQATVTISASPSTVVYLGTTTLTGGGGTVGSFTYYVVSGNCTVGLTSGVLTAGATTAVGTPCVVYAQRAGDANWNNTNSAQLSVSITQAVQSTAVTVRWWKWKRSIHLRHRHPELFHYGHNLNQFCCRGRHMFCIGKARPINQLPGFSRYHDDNHGRKGHPDHYLQLRCELLLRFRYSQPRGRGFVCPAHKLQPRFWLIDLLFTQRFDGYLHRRRYVCCQS